VTLVNLSRSGALIEVSTRYAMKAFVRLKLVRAPEKVTIAPGTVLWSRVNSIVNGQVSYFMAVAFERPIADIEEAIGVREAATNPVADVPEVPPTPTEVLKIVERDDDPAVGREAVEQPPMDDDRARLVLDLTAAMARADALQATLASREQQHQQALRAQHERYQAIIAETVKASTDQQLGIARQRDAAEYQKAQLESRIAALVTEVQVLERRNAAHEERQQALRQEVERLLSVLAAPVDAPTVRPDSVTAFPIPPPAVHAVA
jgi:hypothetical protein